MKARTCGRARSDRSTTTIAGMIVSGDMVTTSASGISWPSTAAQLPDMGSDLSQLLARSAGRQRLMPRTRLVPAVHKEGQPTNVEKHSDRSCL